MYRPKMATRYPYGGKFAVIFADGHMELTEAEENLKSTITDTLGTNKQPLPYSALVGDNDIFSGADDNDPDGTIMGTWQNIKARRGCAWMR